MGEQNLIPFEGKEVRKIWYNEEWYFSVIDVIEVLTDSTNPRKYWSVLKLRESQLATICSQLKLNASDGRKRLTDCANLEGVFRILMSVPSPKVEPLKLWLAQVGKERIEETEQPELGIKRNLEYYKAKGYTDEWIKNRLETINTRNKLTDEWKKRDVKEGEEYAILTAIIAKGTFGLNPSAHKKLKGLEKPSQDLRDNMTPLELIFTQLGEETTRQLAINEDAKGFDENRNKAVRGGNAAGAALTTYEAQVGLKVVSSENYLTQLKEPDKPEALQTSTDKGE